MAKSSVESTAWLTAYLRTFSDIPFSSEIFLGLEDIREEVNEPVIPDEIKKPGLAPQLEARFKLIDKLVIRQKPEQILEFASGLSTRGLSMTLKNPSLKYIELDFPDIIHEKEKIVSKFSKLPKNLLLKRGSALNMEDIEKAITNFDTNKPLVIINEGLMRYLSFEEKTILAKNVQKLLKKFGGVWITSDISLRKILAQEDNAVSNHTKNLAKLARLDIQKNLFDSVEQAKDFFENLGFKIEKHSFLEVNDLLVSPKKLNIAEDQVNLLNGLAVVFIMRID